MKKNIKKKNEVERKKEKVRKVSMGDWKKDVHRAG